MKSAVVIATTVVLLAAGAAAEELSSDQLAVRQVVDTAYVDGIHNFRRVEAVEEGFHPGFEMLILRDGKLDKLPIADWIQRLEERNATERVPADAEPTTSAVYPLIDVTGDVAVCKVELHREGALVFTDYLLLYRFSEGWRIVGKAFHRH